ALLNLTNLGLTTSLISLKITLLSLLHGKMAITIFGYSSLTTIAELYTRVMAVLTVGRSWQVEPETLLSLASLPLGLIAPSTELTGTTPEPAEHTIQRALDAAFKDFASQSIC
ncbi:MAG: hypothetical protein NTW13_02195, partial [Candidatus Omnitrophica bacterium]|nr:hypothetical protein [Candidatus Omnitrophota bacterium]